MYSMQQYNYDIVSETVESGMFITVNVATTATQLSILKEFVDAHYYVVISDNLLSFCT